MLEKLKIFQGIQKHYELVGIGRISENYQRFNWKIIVEYILLFLFVFSLMMFLFLEAKTSNDFANTFNWILTVSLVICTFGVHISKSPQLFQLIDRLENAIYKSKSIK